MYVLTSVDVNTIYEILLPGGWVSVRKGTFSVTPYEMLDDGERVHSGEAGSGFHFQEPDSGGFMSGPIGAILAIRH